MFKHSSSASTTKLDNKTAIPKIDQIKPAAGEEGHFSYAILRRRKYNTKWKQQRLKAIRQNLSFLHILVLYLTLGVTFILVGLLCYFAVVNLPKPIKIDYTDCVDTFRTKQPCFQGLDFEDTKTATCECELEVEVNEELAKERSVLFYYQLDKFFQNTRTYKKDIDWNQLEGKVERDGKAIKPECRYQYYKKDEKYIYPCGKIVNSYFSDTFDLTDANGNPVNFNSKGIAWKSDINHYQNPNLQNWELRNLFDLPRDWHQYLKEHFLSDGGVKNEHFMVWMRTAAFQKFRKKYARINFRHKGTYTLKINYRYEMKSFGGKKSIVIRADREDKPQDFFFFYAYISVGALCLALGPIFFITQLIFKKAVRRKYLNAIALHAEKRNTQVSPEELPQSSQNITEVPSSNVTSVLKK